VSWELCRTIRRSEKNFQLANHVSEEMWARVGATAISGNSELKALESDHEIKAVSSVMDLQDLRSALLIAHEEV
jgi:hypothetical protein